MRWGARPCAKGLDRGRGKPHPPSLFPTPARTPPLSHSPVVAGLRAKSKRPGQAPGRPSRGGEGCRKRERQCGRWGCGNGGVTDTGGTYTGWRKLSWMEKQRPAFGAGPVPTPARAFVPQSSTYPDGGGQSLNEHRPLRRCDNWGEGGEGMPLVGSGRTPPPRLFLTVFL